MSSSPPGSSRPISSPTSPRAPPSAISFASLPSSTPLLTDYGLGALLSVRADGFLEVSLPFGRAFLRPSAVVLFSPGSRVSTDFGRGRVESLEARAGAGLMYRVALLDCNLANGGVAVGVFNARGVEPRKPSAGTTFEEAVEDADKTKLAGNAAFNAGAVALAIDEYRRCQMQLQEAGSAWKSALNAAQKDLLREKFLVAASNLCMAYNKDGKEESLKNVLTQTDGVRCPPPPPPIFGAWR